MQFRMMKQTLWMLGSEDTLVGEDMHGMHLVRSLHMAILSAL